MAWTTPTTRATNFLVTAAVYNTDIVDNLVALQAGAVALTKVQLDGAASDPAVSAAGDATLYYNTTINAVKISLNGANYQAFGAGNGLQDWLFLAGGM